jgi:hypothetical protein
MKQPEGEKVFNTEAFAIALADKFTRDSEARGYALTYDIEVEPGRKFDRLVMSYTRTGDPRRGQRSCHAFIEKATGRLVKSATWKSPARLVTGELQSKFDLSVPEDYQRVLEVADFAGGYLYIR